MLVLILQADKPVILVALIQNSAQAYSIPASVSTIDAELFSK
jgi:hypothetical protein